MIPERLKRFHIRKTSFSVDKNKNSQYPLYGLVAYFVFFYSQPGDRLAFLSPLRIELILGIILLGYGCFRFFKKEIEWKENKLNNASVLFISFLFASSPFAIVITRALESSIRVLKLFAIYMFIVTIIDSEKKLRLIVYVYLSLITLIVVEPFFLSLFGKGFVENNHMLRLAGVTGYFAHPNQLGMYAVTNMPFFYYLYFKSGSKAVKGWCLTYLAIALRVIMLTQSRTAMVGVLAFGFFVWLNSRRKGVLAVVAILSVPLVWFLSPDNTKERFLTLAKSSDIIFQGREALETGNDQDGGPRLGSMATRWEMFQRGFMTFISNPIIGVGMGCYGSYSGRRWGDWFPPHNTYMQLFAELGLIGGFLFMSVIWLTFKNLAESKRILDRMGVKRTFLGSFVPGLATYYCVYLVVAFFGIEIYSNFWWLCGGLSLAVLRITKK